jgi:hypothetical protein
VTVLLFLIAPAVLLVTRQRLQPAWQSPTIVVVTLMEVIGVAGYLLNGRLAATGGGTISGELPNGMADRTAVLFAVTATATAVGSALAAFIRPAPDGPRTRLRPVSVDGKHYPRLLMLACAPLVVVLVSIDPTWLLDRPSYLMPPTAGTGLSAFAANVGIGAVAVCGFLAASSRRHRIPAGVITALYAALYFTSATRKLSLIPIAFALGAYVAVMNRRTRLGLAAAAAAAFGMLPIPLYLRGLPRHGLFPYWQAMPGITDSGATWGTALNNVLIAFPITGQTAYASPQITVGQLLTELNPLPGGVAGWYGISRTMRLNAFTPFSGIGEVGNVGWWAVVAVWVGIGVVLAWLDARCHRLMFAGNQVGVACIVGLAGMFAVASVQYNLRAAQRDLVYATVLVLGIEALRRVRAVSPDPVEAPAMGALPGTARPEPALRG